MPFMSRISARIEKLYLRFNLGELFVIDSVDLIQYDELSAYFICSANN